MERSDPASAALRWVRSRSVTGEHLPARARVALHFNPGDDASEAGVLASILDQGLYVSQFVTGTSNGGLTAFAGGDRWRWEQRIFGGAYDYVDVQHRPVYGALDLDGDPYGPAPRFGSAHLRLRPEVLARATFACPYSTFEPELFGVADRMRLIADRNIGARTWSTSRSGSPRIWRTQCSCVPLMSHGPGGCGTSTGSRARKSGTALRDSAGPGEPRRHFAGFISLSTTHLWFVISISSVLMSTM